MLLTAAFLLRLTLSHSQHAYLRRWGRRQRSKMRTVVGKSLRLSANKQEEQLTTQEESVLLPYPGENAVVAEGNHRKDEPARSALP